MYTILESSCCKTLKIVLLCLRTSYTACAVIIGLLICLLVIAVVGFFCIVVCLIIGLIVLFTITHLIETLVFSGQFSGVIDVHSVGHLLLYLYIFMKN